MLASRTAASGAGTVVIEPHPSTLPPFQPNVSSPSLPSHLEPTNTLLTPRRSSERGVGHHSWLNSYHTFSFARYYHPSFIHFNMLRVINEDRVTGGNGFGRHPHEDAEIFSYIISGGLKHDDSLGHSEVLRRGDVQFTSAGSGVSHSEYNAHPSEVVHFLQVWVLPHTEGLAPVYRTQSWSDDDKRGQLALLLSPDGRNRSILINADVRVYASILSHGDTVTLPLPSHHRAYVHVVMDATGFDSEHHQSSVDVNDVRLLDGDGCFVDLEDARIPGLLRVTGSSAAAKPAELLLFDLGPV